VPLPAPTQTVLVVDDEERVRSVAARLLERSGFTVLTAADGQAGVEVFRAHADTISAVLLDMTMPQMNGEETLRAIHSIRPDARIVIMSGYDEQEISGRFTGLAPAGFLQKPFTPGDLREKIRQITTPNNQDAAGAKP